MKPYKVETISMSKNTPNNVCNKVSESSQIHTKKSHIISSNPRKIKQDIKHVSKHHPVPGTIIRADRNLSVPSSSRGGNVVLRRQTIQHKEFAFGICNPQMGAKFILTSLLDVGDKLSNVALSGTLIQRPKTSVKYSVVLTDVKQHVLKTFVTGDAKRMNEVKLDDILIAEPGYIMFVVTDTKEKMNDVGVVKLKYTYFGY